MIITILVPTHKNYFNYKIIILIINTVMKNFNWNDRFNKYEHFQLEDKWLLCLLLFIIQYFFKFLITFESYIIVIRPSGYYSTVR